MKTDQIGDFLIQKSDKGLKIILKMVLMQSCFSFFRIFTEKERKRKEAFLFRSFHYLKHSWKRVIF